MKTIFAKDNYSYNEYGVKTSRDKQHISGSIDEVETGCTEFDDFVERQEKEINKLRAEIYRESLRKMLYVALGELKYKVYYLHNVKNLPLSDIYKVLGVSYITVKRYNTEINKTIEKLVDDMTSFEGITMDMDGIAHEIHKENCKGTEVDDFDLELEEKMYYDNMRRVESD